MPKNSKSHVVPLEELSRTLLRASAELDRMVSASLDELTVPRWHVLAALTGSAGSESGGSSPAGRSMSELAMITQLPGPSLTRLIDAMVSDNLVHRKVDEADRRRVLVFSTRRGLTALARATEQLAAAERLRSVVTSGPVLTPLLDEMLDEMHDSARR